MRALAATALSILIATGTGALAQEPSSAPDARPAPGMTASPEAGERDRDRDRDRRMERERRGEPRERGEMRHHRGPHHARGWHRKGAPGPRIRVEYRPNGRVSIDVRCSRRESTRECADVTLDIMNNAFDD